MSHTKEPWRASDGVFMGSDVTDIVDADGDDIYVFSEANARRIVACVNKLAGIPTDRLERKCQCDMRTRLVGDGCDICNPALALEYALESLKEAEQQRDELLEAFNQIISLYDDETKVLPMRDELWEMVKIAKQALAKHEGKT